MTKQEIRTLFRQKRSELNDRQVEKMEDLLLIQTQKLALPLIQCVHTYLAHDDHREPDTAHIIRYLQFRNPGVQVAVPRIDKESGHLISVFYEDQMPMEKNRWGIWEPVDGTLVPVERIDLVLVPLLAFDEEGQRVGYGKGYYDRFLATCRNDTISLGLSFFDPVQKISDTNAFDVPLTACVTPYRIYEF